MSKANLVFNQLFNGYFYYPKFISTMQTSAVDNKKDMIYYLSIYIYIYIDKTEVSEPLTIFHIITIFFFFFILDSFYLFLFILDSFYFWSYILYIYYLSSTCNYLIKCYNSSV